MLVYVHSWSQLLRLARGARTNFACAKAVTSQEKRNLAACATTGTCSCSFGLHVQPLCMIVFCTCSICFAHRLHVQHFFCTCNVQIQNNCTCSWDWIAHAGAMFCLHEQASRAVAARAKPCVLFIFLVSPATRMKLPREKSVRSKKVPNRKGRRIFSQVSRSILEEEQPDNQTNRSKLVHSVSKVGRQIKTTLEMDTFIIGSSESNRKLAIAKRITEAASRKVWCVHSLNSISTSYGWTVWSCVFPKTIVANTHDQ